MRSVRSSTRHAVGMLVLVPAILLASAGSVVAADHAVAVGKGGDFYTPATIDIAVGDTVVWTNHGGWHNVRGEGFANTVSNESWTFRHTFTEGGDFPYVCDVHPRMTGTVRVIAAAPPPAETTAPSEPSPAPAPSPAARDAHAPPPSETAPPADDGASADDGAPADDATPVDDATRADDATPVATGSPVDDGTPGAIDEEPATDERSPTGDPSRPSPSPAPDPTVGGEPSPHAAVAAASPEQDRTPWVAVAGVALAVVVAAAGVRVIRRRR